MAFFSLNKVVRGKDGVDVERKWKQPVPLREGHSSFDFLWPSGRLLSILKTSLKVSAECRKVLLAWLAKKRLSGLAAVFCSTAQSYLWPLWCPAPSSWWWSFPTRTGSLTSAAGGGASRKAAKGEEKTKQHQKTSMRESHNGVNILHIDVETLQNAWRFGNYIWMWSCSHYVQGIDVLTVNAEQHENK